MILHLSKINYFSQGFASIFIFMSRKTYEAYVDVFSYLKNLGLSFDEVVLDFEIATRKAVKEVYPACKISHCQFHFAKV